jgi:hypothetical protein
MLNRVTEIKQLYLYLVVVVIVVVVVGGGGTFIVDE